MFWKNFGVSKVVWMIRHSSSLNLEFFGLHRVFLNLIFCNSLLALTKYCMGAFTVLAFLDLSSFLNIQLRHLIHFLFNCKLHGRFFLVGSGVKL